MWRTCPQCEADFFADEPWKRLCLRCWKENNGIESGSCRNDAALAQRVRELERENRLLREQMRNRQPGACFDLALCRLALQLCHPDRHDGSRASTEATRRLLELKDKLG
jgi:hypothetical protein